MVDNYRKNFTHPMPPPLRLSQYVYGKQTISRFAVGTGGQLLEADPFVLLQHALNSTGRPMVTSIRPLQAGCQEATAMNYKSSSNMATIG